MNIIGIGPFVGDFEKEIDTFRPYVRWLYKNLMYDSIYISTHFNRKFLYDFISPLRIIPINQEFTRDELGQEGYIHNNLSLQKDYNIITKIFKEKIIDIECCDRKDVTIFNLTYSKFSPPYPFDEKIFEKIEIKESRNDEILFIPDKKEDENKINDIYEYLKHKVSVVGDLKCYLGKENDILNQIDYIENGYESIVKMIASAKAVITPLGHWTMLCNLQETPVFSWGNYPSNYREGGIYNFQNKKCIVIPSDNDTKVSAIISSIKTFLKNI